MFQVMEPTGNEPDWRFESHIETVIQLILVPVQQEILLLCERILDKADVYD